MSCCNSNMNKACCEANLTEEEKNMFVAVSKALGNDIRIEILEFMSVHPGCITGNIVDYLPLAQSTVSQHLKVLKEAKIVQGEVEGPATKYCINKETLAKYRNLLDKLI